MIWCFLLLENSLQLNLWIMSESLSHWEKHEVALHGGKELINNYIPEGQFSIIIIL